MWLCSLIFHQTRSGHLFSSINAHAVDCILLGGVACSPPDGVWLGKRSVTDRTQKMVL